MRSMGSAALDMVKPW